MMAQKELQSKQSVLVVDSLDAKALDDLNSSFDTTVRLKPSIDELFSLIKTPQAIVLRSGVRLDSSVLEHAQNLKVIARAGAGTDNIDIKVAAQKGIIVFNVPAESARSVAEFSFGLMLAVSRHIALADSQVRKGIWKKADLAGMELYGKTIGIVGLGNIGSEIAKISHGFGMSIIANVQNPSDERSHLFAAQAIKLVALPELLKQADIICLSLPLNEQSKNLIGIDQFVQMKRTSILVNISRAPIVNTDDLLIALQSKLIGGAAIDVLPNESGRTPLDEFSNVVLTPHIGAMTEEAQHRIGQRLVSGIKLALAGHDMPNRIV